jgi:hypothetical protein
MIRRWMRGEHSDLAAGMIYAITVLGTILLSVATIYEAFRGNLFGSLVLGLIAGVLVNNALLLGRDLIPVAPLERGGDVDRGDLERIRAQNEARLDITRQEAAPELGKNDVAHVECYLKGGHEYMAAHIGFERCRWCGKKRPMDMSRIRAGVITGDRIRTETVQWGKIDLGLPQRSGPDEAPAVAGTDALEDIVGFHGGPRDGLKMHIPGAANRKTIQIENGDFYEQITDPDTSEFLGGYVHVPMTPAKRCEMTGHLHAMEHPECMRCGEGS